MLVDHLFQYRISPWPKTAEKRGFCTCVTDIPTDRRTDHSGLLLGQTNICLTFLVMLNGTIFIVFLKR